MSKTKIAVLGGGGGSLFAVWDLVKNNPDDYEITVYQMGWRLGGKGASGRRIQDGAAPRIEEHGLHYMFGFYANVFRVIKEAYAAVYPADWETRIERFFRSTDTQVAVIHFLDAAKKDWEPWALPYPSGPAGVEDLGKPPPEGVDHVALVLRNAWGWIAGVVRDLTHARQASAAPAVAAPAASHWDDAKALVEKVATAGADLVNDATRHEDLIARTGATLDQLANGLPEPLLKKWLSVIHVAKFVLIVAKGLFVDLLVSGKSWFDLDDDFRDWMAKHGADPESPIILGLYDAVFSSFQPLAAGAIVQAFMKAAFLFENSAIFKMQAGMGDTIFTPLYLALTARGVKFEFFQRVENLGLSADKKHVDSITLERQVDLGGQKYDPLVDLDLPIAGGDVIHVPCWPSEPLWARLPAAEAKRISAAGIDLESGFLPREAAREHTLSRGKHFDIVLLGISVAGIREICPELLAEDPPFAAHVAALENTTCATQGLQLWMSKGKTPQQPQPVIVPYVEPYDTVSMMTHLLPAEKWDPKRDRPEAIVYLCSAIENEPTVAARSDATYPGKLREIAVKAAKDWLTGSAPNLWKNLVDTHGSFDWSALFDEEGRTGAARLEAQWVSTPSNLSTRYVIPGPGTHKHRLPSNGTAFDNLYLAGDWILTSLSIGCFEATAMSGIQAARAISLELGSRHTVPRAFGDWIPDVTPRFVPKPKVPPTNQPRYRQRDGDRFVAPPFDVQMKDVFLFVVHADQTKLQTICDNELNLGPTHYAPLGDFVVLYGAAIDDLARGTTTRAREIGFWIPVTAERGGKKRLRTYTPYVWLDSGNSTRVGRTLYGYPKQTAKVSIPAEGAALELEVVGEALVKASGGFDTLNTSIIKMSRPGTWTRPHGLGQAVGPMKLLYEIGKDLFSIPGMGLTELTDLIHGQRSIFLRQFPCATVDGPPIYQALIEATIVPKVTTFSGAGIDHEDWLITVPAYGQPRIADTLGLKGTRQSDGTLVAKPAGTAWMRFDGTLEAGEEIWRG